MKNIFRLSSLILSLTLIFTNASLNASKIAIKTPETGSYTSSDKETFKLAKKLILDKERSKIDIRIGENNATSVKVTKQEFIKSELSHLGIPKQVDIEKSTFLEFLETGSKKTQDPENLQYSVRYNGPNSIVLSASINNESVSLFLDYVKEKTKTKRSSIMQLFKFFKSAS